MVSANRKKLLKFSVLAIILFSILFNILFKSNNYLTELSYTPKKEPRSHFLLTNKRIDEHSPLFLIEDKVSPLKLRIASALNDREIEYYIKNTWNSSKTLEQNRRKLVDDFVKTCVDPVEDFLPVDGGVILKLTSKTGGLHLQSEHIEEIRRKDLLEILYLMTDSPVFCQLLRSLLTKYKTLLYKPQRAIFLFTKAGGANQSSYGTLHYVLNLISSDHILISAIDCSICKHQFSGTIFHEMLHWYHKVCNAIISEKRVNSQTCIRRRLYKYLPSNISTEQVEKLVSYFSNDEEFYTMYGLVEDSNGELVMDPLCEATYTWEQYQYIRASHVYFGYPSVWERQIIINFRDCQLLRFFQCNSLPQFGKGEFACSDINTS
ncbi:MAG: hypothetical protein LBS14_01550 [Holosporaceae bacterium]|jgi:hypothetical protein|nr:hypothetical protein [Holosporaceae bacterium]